MGPFEKDPFLLSPVSRRSSQVLTIPSTGTGALMAMASSQDQRGIGPQMWGSPVAFPSPPKANKQTNKQTNKITHPDKKTKTLPKNKKAPEKRKPTVPAAHLFPTGLCPRPACFATAAAGNPLACSSAVLGRFANSKSVTSERSRNPIPLKWVLKPAVNSPNCCTGW